MQRNRPRGEGRGPCPARLPGRRLPFPRRDRASRTGGSAPLHDAGLQLTTRLLPRTLRRPFLAAFFAQPGTCHHSRTSADIVCTTRCIHTLTRSFHGPPRDLHRTTNDENTDARDIHGLENSSNSAPVSIHALQQTMYARYSAFIHCREPPPRCRRHSLSFAPLHSHFPFPLPPFPFPLPASLFPFPSSLFPLPLPSSASLFPLHASRFPLPASPTAPPDSGGASGSSVRPAWRAGRGRGRWRRCARRRGGPAPWRSGSG